MCVRHRDVLENLQLHAGHVGRLNAPWPHANEDHARSSEPLAESAGSEMITQPLRRSSPPLVGAYMPRNALPDFIATTGIDLEGYDIVQTFGIVRGIVVRSRSLFGTLGAVFQTIRGGDISLLTELCERTRADAYANMVSHAQALGANAVLAVRYDATEIMAGVSEVLCYGTAIRVAPRLTRNPGG
jgi:uncharacterized protein YbjQ (UPF0145 family)